MSFQYKNSKDVKTLQTEMVAEQAKVAANQADSTASGITELVSDFNDLLAKLKAAGLMVAD